jgi:ATP-dependent helicase/nuclease subunit A
VILADTTTPPAGAPQHQPRLLPLQRAGASPDAPTPFVWSVRKDDDVGPMSLARAAIVDAAENEYRRLLYVAMTRAADRLVICGATGLMKKPEGCWYDLVSQALKVQCREEPADDGEGTVFRFRKSAPAHEPASVGIAAVASAQQPLPDWLKQDAQSEAPAPAPLSPSRAYDETILTRSRGSQSERKKALARGDAVHRLLQSLPELPREVRAEAGRGHLARLAEFGADERETMLGQVLALLDDNRFAELFLPGSRAEVPIVGRLVLPDGRAVMVSGQIDRLAVTGDVVLIADYKTNRPAPAKPPDAYVAQLALYRAVLAQLYPDKRIRAALIWTDVPDLVEISASDLDAALARVSAS